MSCLDDIEKRVNARMNEIERRINGEKVPCRSEAPCQQPSSGTSSLQSLDFPSLFAKPTATATGSFSSVDAPATLTQEDLLRTDLSGYSLVGLAPGDSVPSSGNVQLDQIFDAIAKTAASKRLPLGCCMTVIDDGSQKGLLTREFPGPSLFLNGIPIESKTDAEALQVLIARAVAYFAVKWNYDRMKIAQTLWSFVQASVDLSRGTVDVSSMDNAFSSFRGGGNTVLCFSPLTASQDVVGHEFTHSVTADMVDWHDCYMGETGAINESMADIFGKFIHWAWVGRRASDKERWIITGMRNMAHPDRPVSDKGWIAASYYREKPHDGKPNSGWYVGTDDNGGVHINNGVLTRLCFLLCEGEDFTRSDGKSFSVLPIGFDKTELLFATMFLGKRRYMTKTVRMYNFCRGLLLAARDIGLSDDEQNRVFAACEAVNIVPECEMGVCASKQALWKGVRLNKVSMSAFASREAMLARAVSETLKSELGLTAPGAGFAVAESTSAADLPPGVNPSVPPPNAFQLVLEQEWNGLPVFGSSAIARVEDGDVVTCLQNGFSQKLGAVADRGDKGETAAKEAAVAGKPGQHAASARKVVYDPSLLGLEGSPVIAWQVKTESCGFPADQVLVEASTGRILLTTPLRTN